MPKFSVLLSVYEKENSEYLIQALNSVAQQSLIPDEIVIVEDGPITKELDSAIKNFSEQYPDLVKIVSFPEKRGLGLALRDGVLECSNEYIARMDTDDIAAPDRFEKQMEYMKKHPRTALLGGWVKEFSEDAAKPETVTRLPCDYEKIKIYARKRNPFRHMTVIFQKRAVLDSGNYRNFPGFEDYDLWIRMLQKGYIAENLPEYLVSVRADDKMFARRGGQSYLKQELNFQKYLLKSGYISHATFAKNVAIRSFVRMAPNSLRVAIYKKLLREKA